MFTILNFRVDQFYFIELAPTLGRRNSYLFGFVEVWRLSNGSVINFDLIYFMKQNFQTY
jgi:hypothetical protein